MSKPSFPIAVKRAAVTVKECLIGVAPSGGLVAISPSLWGTITLSQELYINKTLIITGPGAGRLAVSGDNQCRVFKIGPWGNVAKGQGSGIVAASDQ